MTFKGKNITVSLGTSLKEICYIAHEEKDFFMYKIYENKSR